MSSQVRKPLITEAQSGLWSWATAGPARCWPLCLCARGRGGWTAAVSREPLQDVLDKHGLETDEGLGLQAVGSLSCERGGLLRPRGPSRPPSRARSPVVRAATLARGFCCGIGVIIAGGLPVLFSECCHFTEAQVVRCERKRHRGELVIVFDP